LRPAPAADSPPPPEGPRPTSSKPSPAARVRGLFPS
jgi:hypothetical protein